MVEITFWKSNNCLPLLQNHPRFLLKPGQVHPDEDVAIEFNQTGWKRQIRLAANMNEGIVLELSDQNPLLCLDAITSKDAIGTATSLLLVPLIQAGLLKSIAEVTLSQTSEKEDFLQMRAMLPTINITVEDILECWDEKYSRCPSIRIERDKEAPNLRLGVVQLAVIEGAENAKLELKLTGYLEGRLGDIGIIQLLNIACGFDERLGLERYF